MRRNWLFVLALSIGGLSAICPATHAGDAPAASAAERTKWGEHMGDLPFIVGFEKGMKEVEFTGKPPLLFFTATW